MDSAPEPQAVSCQGGVCRLEERPGGKGSTNADPQPAAGDHPQYGRDFDSTCDFPSNSPLSLLTPEGSGSTGSVLEDEGGQPANLSLLKGKLVGLYFSAGWCPPCRAFSPRLAEFAKCHADDLVVVFVSSDYSEQEMKAYINGKGFLRIRWDSGARRQLCAYLGISMLPTLVICDADSGSVVTTWGRAAMMANQRNCIAEWRRGSNGLSLMSMMGLNNLWLNKYCMG